MTSITLSDAERYVTRGLVYKAGVFDCGSLAALVQRELFGRHIRLPAADGRSLGRRGQAREIAAQQIASPLSRPVTGCAVVFWQSTSTGQAPLNRHWHLGTAFLQDGAVWVLHGSNETSGVLLQRLTELTRRGMHLDGFYQWH